MLWMSLAVWSLFALLHRALVAHLAVVNEGSPSSDQAFRIDDVSLAQAFYGKLGNNSADYYRFEAKSGTLLKLSMLIPQHFHAAGFQAEIVLRGPGLPAQGLTLDAEDKGMRIGTTDYKRTQQADIHLDGGAYQVEIRAVNSGAYCFCVGVREPTHYADEATRARVRELLEIV